MYHQGSYFLRCTAIKLQLHQLFGFDEKLCDLNFGKGTEQTCLILHFQRLPKLAPIFTKQGQLAAAKKFKQDSILAAMDESSQGSLSDQKESQSTSESVGQLPTLGFNMLEQLKMGMDTSDDPGFIPFPLVSHVLQKGTVLFEALHITNFNNVYIFFKPQDSFSKKDKTFSWSAESAAVAAHRQKTLINLAALVLNDVFSCNNVQVAKYRYVHYLWKNIFDIWVISWKLKQFGVSNEQGIYSSYRSIKIMHWQKNKKSLLIFCHIPKLSCGFK